jgi:cytochrome c-type biogenesis protein
MGTRLAVSFAAGFASVITPCVLPLVPGYLSALSSVEAGRLGGRGTARRVLVSSIPFIAGFTVVFVVLGAGAAAIGGVLSGSAQTDVAGFVLVVIGLAFARLLPLPQRVVAPGLLVGARDSGSNVLLGGAFAVCAAPCVSPILVSALVLAGASSTVAQGAVLLFAYSLGLAVPFVLVGVVFAPAMGSFRWLRDRFHYFEVAGGLMLVGLGLLFFFGRMWWLRGAFHHVI